MLEPGGEQIRTAKWLLGWNQNKLEKAAGLALTTVIRMEWVEDTSRAKAGNLWSVQRVLEATGIIFID